MAKEVYVVLNPIKEDHTLLDALSRVSVFLPAFLASLSLDLSTLFLIFKSINSSLFSSWISDTFKTWSKSWLDCLVLLLFRTSDCDVILWRGEFLGRAGAESVGKLSLSACLGLTNIARELLSSRIGSLSLSLKFMLVSDSTSEPALITSAPNSFAATPPFGRSSRWVIR